MSARSETDEERRRRRRALIRAHHPDTGGDPAEFIRLLHHFDQEGPLGECSSEMRFVHRRRWWQVAVSISLLRRTSRRPKRVV
jgi:hypothetical protein